MATLGQLQTDVAGWMERGDLAPFMPGWMQMLETDLAETLRARCMVLRARQAIDADFISLPADWVAWEGVRDAATGKTLSLEDHWTGPKQTNGSPVLAYRMVGDCIEFLPHPTLDPSRPDTLQYVDTSWYAKPKPLRNTNDTNAVLERHYAVYLFGMIRYAAKFELDADRMAQSENDFVVAVQAANQWKAQSDFSGAPLRAVTRGF